MTNNDLGIPELAPGHYHGTVERVRYVFKATTKISITYKLVTPDGVRRLTEKILISAPPASTSYFYTTRGLGRVEDLLRTKGLTLTDAQTAGGLQALPGLLEGTTVTVITGNRRIAGFNTPIVVRIEKPRAGGAVVVQFGKPT